jgi:hypothetical protein
VLHREGRHRALAYFCVDRSRADALPLTCSPKDEARRIAANIAKLPELLREP